MVSSPVEFSDGGCAFPFAKPVPNGLRGANHLQQTAEQRVAQLRPLAAIAVAVAVSVTTWLASLARGVLLLASLFQGCCRASNGPLMGMLG
jgi:hypothetical protein